eukprot:gene7933-9323_t
MSLIVGMEPPESPTPIEPFDSFNIIGVSEMFDPVEGRVGWDATKTTDLPLAYGAWRLDSRFVVVDKPAGIPVQDPSESVDTVEHRIRANLMASTASKEAAKSRLFFPHRIDKWTTGLLVVAFDQSTASTLGRAMQNREWTKRYRVVTEVSRHGRAGHGERSYRVNCGLTAVDIRGSGLLLSLHKIPVPIGDKATAISRLKARLLEKTTIENNIGRRQEPVVAKSAAGSGKTTLIPPSCEYCVDQVALKTTHPFVASHFLYGSIRQDNSPVSSLARTDATLVEVFERDGRFFSIHEATLQTGKTHQIRIHFADSGFPIVDDPYYNPFTIETLAANMKPQHEYNDMDENDNVESSIINMGLQSHFLGLNNPITGQPLSLTLDPPNLEGLNLAHRHQRQLSKRSDETANIALPDSLDSFEQAPEQQELLSLVFLYNSELIEKFKKISSNMWLFTVIESDDLKQYIISHQDDHDTSMDLSDTPHLTLEHIIPSPMTSTFESFLYNLVELNLSNYKHHSLSKIMAPLSNHCVNLKSLNLSKTSIKHISQPRTSETQMVTFSNLEKLICN